MGDADTHTQALLHACGQMGGSMTSKNAQKPSFA